MAKIEILAILFGALILSHSFAQAGEPVLAKTIENQIQSASDSEYLHCIPTNAKDTDSVVHYIFDVKNEWINALYVTSGAKSLKAEQLTGLSVIDTELVIDSKEGFDVSTSSPKNNLSFELVVRDDGGQFLTGTLTNKNQKIAIECRDVVVD